MTHSIRLKSVASIGAPVLLALFALTGCGGGDNGEAPAPAAAAAEAGSVPSSAGTSVQALVDYQRGMAASNDTEPLTMSGFLAPNSDTAEPFAIN